MANDIFVIVDHLEGNLADITFELLGKGRELAQGLGGRLVAVCLGSGIRSFAQQLGAADMVLAVDHPELAHYNPEAYKKVLGALLKERTPRLTMVPSTTAGLDLAAGLSIELSLPLVAYCQDIRLEDGRLIAVSQIYGGKIMAEAVVQGDQAIASVLAGSFSADAGRGLKACHLEEVALAVSLDAPRVRFKALIPLKTGDVDITKVPVLVSIGRGIKSKDNVPLVQALADALGGALSASRPIVDQGWLPKTRQVGKSGLTVKPKLYIALGISGAPEHLEGMRGSELIIAINSDRTAPIFNTAHYGIVGDLFDGLPLLVEKVKATK